MNPIASTADLLDLQELDLRIDQLLDERASLPELETYKATHGSLAESTARHETLNDQLQTTNRELDKTEGEAQILRAKLESVQVQMYSGGASAKEVQHLGMEVEQIKGQIATLEDAELELMEVIEGLEPQVETEAERIAELTAEKERLEATIKEAWKGIDAELARKEARKAEEVKGIDPVVLDPYEKLRDLRGGRVVAPLEEGNVCGSCHVAMSHAEAHALRKEGLPRCTHCGRLLAV